MWMGSVAGSLGFERRCVDRAVHGSDGCSSSPAAAAAPSLSTTYLSVLSLGLFPSGGVDRAAHSLLEVTTKSYEIDG